MTYYISDNQQQLKNIFTYKYSSAGGKPELNDLANNVISTNNQNTSQQQHQITKSRCQDNNNNTNGRNQISIISQQLQQQQQQHQLNFNHQQNKQQKYPTTNNLKTFNFNNNQTTNLESILKYDFSSCVLDAQCFDNNNYAEAEIFIKKILDEKNKCVNNNDLANLNPNSHNNNNNNINNIKTTNDCSNVQFRQNIVKQLISSNINQKNNQNSLNNNNNNNNINTNKIDVNCEETLNSNNQQYNHSNEKCNLVKSLIIKNQLRINKTECNDDESNHKRKDTTITTTTKTNTVGSVTTGLIVVDADFNTKNSSNENNDENGEENKSENDKNNKTLIPNFNENEEFKYNTNKNNNNSEIKMKLQAGLLPSSSSVAAAASATPTNSLQKQTNIISNKINTNSISKTNNNNNNPIINENDFDLETTNSNIKYSLNSTKYSSEILKENFNNLNKSNNINNNNNNNNNNNSNGIIDNNNDIINAQYISKQSYKLQENRKNFLEIYTEFSSNNNNNNNEKSKFINSTNLEFGYLNRKPILISSSTAVDSSFNSKSKIKKEEQEIEIEEIKSSNMMTTSNSKILNTMTKFEDLQKAGILLRKALRKLKKNEIDLSSNENDECNNLNNQNQYDLRNGSCVNYQIRTNSCLMSISPTSSSSNSSSNNNSCNNSTNFSDTMSINKKKLQNEFFVSSSSPEMELIQSENQNSNSDICLAYDNLTYFSSIEDLVSVVNFKTNNKNVYDSSPVIQSVIERSEECNENKNQIRCQQNSKNQIVLTNQINSEILKKTLKSIKRKDRLKKNPNSNLDEIMNTNPDNYDTEETFNGTNLIQAKSMPDLTICCSNQSENVPSVHQDNLENEELVKNTPIFTLDSNQATEEDQQQQQQHIELISNNEYEKQMRKKLRSKVLSRSLRRAKSVFYRNQRSKSLEDLSNEDRNNYLMKAGSNTNLNGSRTKLRMSSNRLSRNNSSSSMDSCSSAASNGLASDISSSYFHELSDWSPEFSSSDSESSEELFENIDWDANLRNVALSGFNSSRDDESSEENESDSENDDEDDYVFKKIDEFKNKLITTNTTNNNSCNQYINNNKIDQDLRKCEKPVETNIRTIGNSEDNCLAQIFEHKSEMTLESIENMLNEIMSRMLLMHPGLFGENSTGSPASFEFIENLKQTQITSEYLCENRSQLECSICLAAFELDEDVTTLSCDHTFHIICIKVWLSKSATCPICRHSCQSSKNQINLNDKRSLVKRETLL